jgi:hypothetical protein
MASTTIFIPGSFLSTGQQRSVSEDFELVRIAKKLNFYFHYFLALIITTMTTNMVRPSHFMTLRALHIGGDTETQVGSSFSLFGLGCLFLWNCHFLSLFQLIF